MYPPDALRRFIQPGDLCFDIGAHEGKHTGWLLELGARVIAVEPQGLTTWPYPIPSPDGNLKLLHYGVTDRCDNFATMYIDPDHTYMSTLEHDYTEQVKAHAPYDHRKSITVATITLDRLIERFGVPAFCKIDVEGHERKVFDGLSQALPALSFEVHDFDPKKASYCMAHLSRLSNYEWWYSPRESFDLEPLTLDRIAHLDLFGDIYGVEVQSG